MTASRIVFDGIVPVFTHAPPTAFRLSTIATRRRSFAAWIAAFWPAGPDPMTSSSNSNPSSTRGYTPAWGDEVENVLPEDGRSVVRRFQPGSKLVRSQGAAAELLGRRHQVAHDTQHGLRAVRERAEDLRALEQHAARQWRRDSVEVRRRVALGA